MICTNNTDINDVKLFISDIQSSWLLIFFSCIIAIIFSYILFIAYRHATRFTVGSFYFLSIVFIGGLSVFCFVESANDDDEAAYNSSASLFSVGIVFAIAAVFFAIYFYIQSKRIELVVQLFKETSKALVDLPKLFIQPFYTFVAIVLASICYWKLRIVIDSSGEIIGGKLHQDGFIQMASVFNLIAYVWFIQFVIACQHFIIAR
jgi:hypothetical protein